MNQSRETMRGADGSDYLPFVGASIGEFYSPNTRRYSRSHAAGMPSGRELEARRIKKERLKAPWMFVLVLVILILLMISLLVASYEYDQGLFRSRETHRLPTQHSICCLVESVAGKTATEAGGRRPVGSGFDFGCAKHCRRQCQIYRARPVPLL